MTWSGRIIGAIIGFILLKFFGLIVGFALGYFLYDRQKNQRKIEAIKAQRAFTGNSVSPEYHERLVTSTFRLMGYVARGAGNVNVSHISLANHVMDMMMLSESMRQAAQEAFNFGKSSQFDLNREMYSLQELVGNNAQLIIYLLEIQVATAIADENLSPGEHERLINIARIMGVDLNQMENLIQLRLAEQRFTKFTRRYNEARQQAYEQRYGSNYGSYQQDSWQQSSQQQSGWQEQQSQQSGWRQKQRSNESERQSWRQQQQSQQSKRSQQHDESKFEEDEDTESFTPHGTTSDLATAYKLLGVSPDASMDEVRRAFKKMMLKYHPDRMAAQGATPEMIKAFNEKCQTYQAAYALIKKHRGKR